jgi:hypothetical protein
MKFPPIADQLEAEPRVFILPLNKYLQEKLVHLEMPGYKLGQFS